MSVGFREAYLLAPSRTLDDVATDRTVAAAAGADAWFVFSLSGGKDCGAVSALAMHYLDSIGQPNHFPTAGAVIDRFAELLARASDRRTRKAA